MRQLAVGKRQRRYGVKSNMEDQGDIKKEMETVVKIMLELEGFSGEKAVEILIGVLVSIITTTANKGAQGMVVDAVIKELKDGMKVMKNIPQIFAVIGIPKKNQPVRPGGKPSLN